MRPLKVTLNKLAVAKRQIDTAIWLWFNDGDVVSIVSLTGAALGVLDGLYQKAKKGRPFPFDEKTIPKRRKRAGRFHSTKRPFPKGEKGQAVSIRRKDHSSRTHAARCA